jgi:hypothetical protein
MNNSGTDISYVKVGTARPLGCLAGRLTHSVGQSLCVLRKILEQDFGRTQVGIHPAGRKQRPQRAAQSQAVETAQNCFDQAAEFVTKFYWNEVVGEGGLLHSPFIASLSLVPEFLFGCGYAALGKDMVFAGNARAK